MTHKTTEELKTIIDTYENGNKADFREALKTLDALDTANLIGLWQPYHNAIAKIQISYEVMER